MAHPALAPAALPKRKPEAAQPRPPRRPAARKAPAVTRAIAILRLLGKSSEPLGVNAVARELDLIPSTCLHILRVLVTEELVAFDPESKHYSLDEGIVAIARSVLRRNSFASVVQQGLDQLSQRYGVAAVGVKVT